jgi:hypothetical protein
VEVHAAAAPARVSRDLDIEAKWFCTARQLRASLFRPCRRAGTLAWSSRAKFSAGGHVDAAGSPCMEPAWCRSCAVHGSDLAHVQHARATAVVHSACGRSVRGQPVIIATKPHEANDHIAEVELQLLAV